ncbi:hypothetical protein N9J88_03375 [Porticoccaceae bacterium]|nr:hypothetical protein [Porticoccaceae bacterium]
MNKPEPNPQNKRLLRLKDIIGDKKSGIPPIIPVSRTLWWSGIKEGRFPAGIKISARCTAWTAEAIYDLSDRLAAGEVK